MKKKYILVLFLCCFGLLLEACSKETDSLKNEEVSVRSQYQYYDTLHGLCNDSNMIIYGGVTEVQNPQKINISSEEDKEDFQIYTISKVIVKEALKGDIEKGDELYIKQYGGEYEGINYVEEGMELCKEGDIGIFFIETYEPKTSEEMPYSILNNKQGFFKVEDGLIEKDKSGESFRKDLFGKTLKVKEILQVIKSELK